MTAGSGKVLHFFCWPDYISLDTIRQFSERLGVEIQLKTYAGNEELLTRLQSGGKAYDIIVPTSYLVPTLISEDLVLPLDHSLLPNLVHIDDLFRRRRPHDPGDRYSITKDWGTVGMLYRSDLLAERPVSLAEFWALAEKYSGKVTVPDTSTELIGFALKLLGYSYNDVEPAHLEEALIKMRLLLPHLLAFESNYRPLLSSGQAVISLGWNGDGVALRAAGLQVEYVIPAEGGALWEDDWSIPRAANNPEFAHLFLNFVMEPEVAAQEANYTRYATPNRHALAFLEPEVSSNPLIYPPAEIMKRLEPALPLRPEGKKRREEIWKALRPGMHNPA